MIAEAMVGHKNIVVNLYSKKTACEKLAHAVLFIRWEVSLDLSSGLEITREENLSQFVIRA
jgi:hypothetical protein